MRFLAFGWWLFCTWLLTTNGLLALHDGLAPLAAVWFVGAAMAFDNLRDTKAAS